MMGINIVTANFSNGGRQSITRKLYQYDYGQIINIKGLNLPKAFEVHISNSNKASTAQIYIGNNDQIEIPDKFLLSGEDIYLWIFLHSTATDGQTRYTITVPVQKKPKPESEESTEVERNTIDQLIAALEINLNEMRQATEDAKTEMDEATAAAKEQMQLAIDKANDIVSKYPKIVDDYWYIYDVENQVWVNTQIKALAVDGVGIENIVYNNDYTITINLTDGTSYTTNSIRGQKGEKGETGATPNIKIQSTETLAPNQYANVIIEGTPEEPKLTFKIPKGEKGDKGDTGAMPQISIGTVETLLPHRAGYVTQTGTAENPILNFGLVKGETGEQGPQGIQGPKGDKGDTGQTGLQGPKGDTGETGPQGPKGADGTMTFEDLTPEQKAGLKGDTGATGADGKSAYQVAVDNGFVGNEATWLASLVGAAGQNGTDGDDGITPTVTITNITGGHNIAFDYGIGDSRNTDVNIYDGQNGTNGTNGQDGHSPVVTASKSGTVTTISVDGTSIATINDGAQGIQGETGATGPQGPKGDKGDTGAAGADGADGEDGKSAYEYAVDGGYTGTEQEFAQKLTEEGVLDVQVNGTSVVTNGVANVPIATDQTLGVVKFNSTYGVRIQNGFATIQYASNDNIKAGISDYRPIVPTKQDRSVFYGLAKAAGDTTQAASSNPVGTYTEEAKAAIRAMLGIN